VASLFFSYSHADEGFRDQLETHLAGLRRQGVISVWHDRRITTGSELDEVIDSYISTVDVILLLISPDFIASDYCCEREMSRALERHEKGEARVIPVVLRPCDWHGLPFGKLLATPTDGRPVTKWPNIDEAFLNIVTAIKGALEERGEKGKPSPRGRAMSAAARPLQEPVRSSNLRIKKTVHRLR
jgi:TIR domain-containing protein